MSDWHEGASGLPEPCAGTTRTHGSEGREGQRCPSLTRPCEDPFETFTYVRYDELWRKRQLYCLAVWDGVREFWQEEECSRKGIAFLEENAESFNWRDDEHPKYEEADCAIMTIDGELSKRFWTRIVAGDDESWNKVHTRMDARLTDWHDPNCLKAGAALTVVAEALYDGFVRRLAEVRPQLTASWVARRIESNAMKAGGGAFSVWRSQMLKAAALVREVFHFPFRKPTIQSSWLTWNDGLVTRLAQVAYDDRHLPKGTLDNGRLAILADALEEAGCTDADILGHLRRPGPHVRGCWPVDLCLGNS